MRLAGAHQGVGPAEHGRRRRCGGHLAGGQQRLRLGRAGHAGRPVGVEVSPRQPGLPAGAVVLDGGHRAPLRPGGVRLPLGGAAGRDPDGGRGGDAGRVAQGPARATPSSTASSGPPPTPTPRSSRPTSKRPFSARPGSCWPAAPARIGEEPPADGELGSRLPGSSYPERWLVVSDRRGVEPFGAQDATLLEALAGVSATALQNATLVEQLQARGVPRLADGAAQPVAVRGDGQPGAGRAAPAGAQAGGLRARPRPVQAGQRQSRPPGRQRAPPGGRPPTDRGGAGRATSWPA